MPSWPFKVYTKYGSLGPSFQAIDNDSRCQLLNSSNEKNDEKMTLA